MAGIVFFGTEKVVVMADIAFTPDLDTGAMDETITAIEDAVKAHRPGVRKVYIEPET
jgi:divalent metal cation (Fe/Co/Zn/Cd) transporter